MSTPLDSTSYLSDLPADQAMLCVVFCGFACVRCARSVPKELACGS